MGTKFNGLASGRIPGRGRNVSSQTDHYLIIITQGEGIGKG